jgi:ribonuclease D
MFCRSVVDVQSLCRVKLQRAQPVDLKECAKVFLNVDMDKSLQRGEFMLRPLSQEMIKYASNDTKVLLRLWNKLKSDVNIDLRESFESTIKVYRFPKPKYDCFSEYLKYGGSINYDVWKNMYNWRLKCAKRHKVKSFVAN